MSGDTPMPERERGHERGSEPIASLLSVDTQQIALALPRDDDDDMECDDDARRPSGDVLDKSRRGDDCQHPQQQRQPKRVDAKQTVRSNSSHDAGKVMPDLREERSKDGAGSGHQPFRNGDSADDRNLQERATMDTAATTPVATPSNAQTPVDPDRSSILSADLAIWNIVQLLRPSSVMDKQIYMSVGALVLSLVLGACALCFRDEIFNVTHVNAGLILGSAGTLVMCAIIIGTYLTTKWYRRHMHILLLNLAVFDFLLALSFVLEPVWKRVGAGVGPGLSCRWVRSLRLFGSAAVRVC